MLALADISVWHWAGFVVAVLVFLALDLGLFHRKAHVVSFKEALGWTAVWFAVAMLFAFFLGPALIKDWQKQDTVEFVTGYIIELSLSMDNVFVIALIFTYFKVGQQYQHRVLFWGILGALLMRGVMIGAGALLIQTFSWTLYLFGAFLVFTGIKMLLAGDDDGVQPDKNPVIRLARKFFPISTQFDGEKFLTTLQAETTLDGKVLAAGRSVLTPLAVVLIVVETTDLVFAVDSIPAIFAITKKPFLVFTSNVFAILGLRSLYFVLANAIHYFRYLKVGLSAVLVFIGIKMLLPLASKIPGMENKDLHISPVPSLLIVGGILFAAIAASLVAGLRQRGKK